MQRYPRLDAQKAGETTIPEFSRDATAASEAAQSAHTVCRRLLYTGPALAIAGRASDEGRFIPVLEPDSSPFERGIQNEAGALGNVDRDSQ